MEKSIETIWKEGFLKSDSLQAPQIDNLYRQKSIHIIDKFKRMFRINLIAIVVFGFVFLILSYLVGIPVMGVLFFIVLMILYAVNKKLFNGLEKLDKGNSSYEYLKSFNVWIIKHKEINSKIATFFYPIVFIALLVGFWFKDAKGVPLGERVVTKILMVYPDTYLVFGIPLIGIVIAIILLVVIAYFGGRIFQWDLNLVYGRVFKKLELLMKDIEDLNN
jgi:hypothetical protein